MQITKNQNVQNTAKYAAAGAAITGGAAGISALVKQKKILSNPDAFITKIEGEVARARIFNTAFHKGTREAADLANKTLDETLNKLKSFAKGGKFDFKAIAKTTAAAGAIGAAVGAGIYALFKMNKHEKRENAKILAEELAKIKTAEESANTVE